MLVSSVTHSSSAFPVRTSISEDFRLERATSFADSHDANIYADLSRECAAKKLILYHFRAKNSLFIITNPPEREPSHEEVSYINSFLDKEMRYDCDPYLFFHLEALIDYVSTSPRAVALFMPQKALQELLKSYCSPLSYEHLLSSSPAFIKTAAKEEERKPIVPYTYELRKFVLDMADINIEILSREMPKFEELQFHKEGNFLIVGETLADKPFLYTVNKFLEAAADKKCVVFCKAVVRDINYEVLDFQAMNDSGKFCRGYMYGLEDQIGLRIAHIFESAILICNLQRSKGNQKLIIPLLMQSFYLGFKNDAIRSIAIKGSAALNSFEKELFSRLLFYPTAQKAAFEEMQIGINAHWQRAMMSILKNFGIQLLEHVDLSKKEIALVIKKYKELHKEKIFDFSLEEGIEFWQKQFSDELRAATYFETYASLRPTLAPVPHIFFINKTLVPKFKCFLSKIG